MKTVKISDDTTLRLNPNGLVITQNGEKSEYKDTVVLTLDEIKIVKKELEEFGY